MKLIYIVILFLIMGFESPKGANITLIVSNIEEVKGQIKIALYDKKADFLHQEQKYKGAVVKIDSTTVKYIFTNIPHGKYAITLFHDKNSNGKIDRNFIGLPSEGTAFSNNIRPHFGPPKYEDAVFDLVENITIRLQMVY